MAQSNPAVPDGQSPVQRSRTQTGPAKAHNVFDHRVSVLRSIGEAGEHKHRRVRIVSQSRPLFGSYYALRTTHDVVIAPLNPCYKEITWPGGTSISVLYFTFHCEGQIIQNAPSIKLGFSCGALLEYVGK